jgi:hypothetical protein
MKNYQKINAALLLREIRPAAKTKRFHLYVQLTIDAHRLFLPGRQIYPKGLICSATEAGRHFIFCNECCSGFCPCREVYETEVVHYKDSILWKRNQNLKTPAYRFYKKQYIEAVQQLADDIDVSMKKYQRQLQNYTMRAWPNEMWEEWLTS